MSNSKWSKRWLYDTTVGVPKTTRWRRRINFTNLPLEENVTVDNVRGEFTSEVIEDLNHTSPFKRQKLLGDCLCDEDSEADLESDTNEDDYEELGNENSEVDLENDPKEDDHEELGYEGECFCSLLIVKLL